MVAIDFWYDFGSPNAYLAHRVIPELEARLGVAFAYRPALLGGLFKMTGNSSPVDAYRNVPHKLAYERLEFQRFIERHGISDFIMNPHFPINTLQMMRGPWPRRNWDWRRLMSMPCLTACGPGSGRWAMRKFWRKRWRKRVCPLGRYSNCPRRRTSSPGFLRRRRNYMPKALLVSRHSSSGMKSTLEKTSFGTSRSPFFAKPMSLR